MAFAMYIGKDWLLLFFVAGVFSPSELSLRKGNKEE